MIYILGSIGAGKTSLTKLLSADLGTPAYYEDVEGNGMIAKMLQKFYEAGEDSRKTTGTILQIAFLTFRYQQLKKAVMQENAVLDSSLESDFVMASQLHQNGEIDDVDFNIYVTLSQEMQLTSMVAHGMVCLTSPSTCKLILTTKLMKFNTVVARWKIFVTSRNSCPTTTGLTRLTVNGQRATPVRPC